ncbi:unnamed protein product [Rotaria sp. Silwood1]|nr:unnamed protein product [Rotaria sp. Silwood1]
MDFNPTEQVTSGATNNEQQEFQPKTVLDKNCGRIIYLPLFPTQSTGINDSLLLANVPVTRLASHEIARRKYGAHTPDALILENKYKYVDRFSLTEADAHELSVRLQIGKAIITFNADRLRGICCTLMALHESFRRNILLKKDVALKEPTLNSKQMAIALEFYLQIDVDVFFMKTCSFGGAVPRSITEGLFCGQDEPQARYTVHPCGNLSCLCCHPINSCKKTKVWPIVDFASSSMHQFVNGYTTYLNCPATCATRNLVYAMTCPCGHYDYIDSTAKTLADAMTFHHIHGNRIIHEKLTGSTLFRGSLLDLDEQEKQMTNKMRLYQHSARCPVALRSFLDCNPVYWCFIPLCWDEALAENTNCYRGYSVRDPDLAYIFATNATDTYQITQYLDRVPLPPTAYTFSYRQLQKQRAFFRRLILSSIHDLPYITVDLYKMAIIAVCK